MLNTDITGGSKERSFIQRGRSKIAKKAGAGSGPKAMWMFSFAEFSQLKLRAQIHVLHV